MIVIEHRILLVDLIQLTFLSSQSRRINAIQQVTKHLISHLLSRREMNAEEISHLSPKTIQSILHVLNSGNSVSLLYKPSFCLRGFLHGLSKLLRPSTTGVLCQHLVGYLIICRKLRIASPYLFPDRSAFHEINYVLPLLLIG